MFNINKITAEQPSVDPYRSYNRNNMEKFQTSWNFLHWLKANQKQ